MLCDAELLLADGGDGVKGKFLLRVKGSSSNDFVLSAIYKGAPTHHTVARAGEGEEFTINKQPTGCYALDDVRYFVTRPHPFHWLCVVTRRAGGSTVCAREGGHCGTAC